MGGPTLSGPTVQVTNGLYNGNYANGQPVVGATSFNESTVSDAGTFVLTETSLFMHCWGLNPVVTAKLQLKRPR